MDKWYSELTLRCRLCAGTPAMDKHRDGYLMVCEQCGDQTASGTNEGVAICNWNIRQRQKTEGNTAYHRIKAVRK